MRTRSSILALAATVCTLLAGGCAPAASGAGDTGAPSAAAEGRITAQVRNSLAPPTAVTVYALDGTGGARRILGNVSPNGTATLAFDPALTTGTYRLMARTTAGRELVSTPFTVSEGQTVVWDIQLNSIQVR